MADNNNTNNSENFKENTNKNVKNNSENASENNSGSEPTIPTEQILDQYPGGEIPDPIPVNIPAYTVPQKNTSPSYIESYKKAYEESFKKSYIPAYTNAFESFIAPKKNFRTTVPNINNSGEENTNTKKPKKDVKKSNANNNSNFEESNAEEQSGGFIHDLEGALPNPEDTRNPHEEEGPEPPLEDF